MKQSETFKGVWILSVPTVFIITFYYYFLIVCITLVLNVNGEH